MEDLIQTPFDLTTQTAEDQRIPNCHKHPSPTDPSTVTNSTPVNSLLLNWTERQLPERDRTKHVHRLHPYLGKYIPQLVEVFLRKYFHSGMTVLDPFSGSGTTVLQANELGINGIGCDISAFNILIGSVKAAYYDLDLLRDETDDIINRISSINASSSTLFPNLTTDPPQIENDNDYLSKWFAPNALNELLVFRRLIHDYHHQDYFNLILSRSARSARLTTHFDLDFPKTPTTQPYTCYKHSRICSPTTTALKFLIRYCQDSLTRVTQYSRLRTPSTIRLIHGDSRLAQFPLVDGVITSPPYVGLIDYHEQHRYAFELLGLPDNRDGEIGPAAKGQSIAAKDAYIRDMTAVFRNVTGSILPGGKLIVVAGDRHNLYPNILNSLGLSHERTVQRHVNRRTGRRSGEFFESVFVYTRN